MNKQLSVYLLFSLLAGNARSFAQAQGGVQQLPHLVPPSPNVQAMQKFGDIPVGLYTGTPNISVPLYEIKSDDISVPISISYHASGIKVADEASRVGLGWALNAGSVISRTINGADDFKGNGGLEYHNNGTSPELVSGNNMGYGPGFQVQRGCYLSIPGYSSTVNDLIRSGYDFQPDQYSYSAGNYSGKFILKRNKGVIFLKKEKVKVNPIVVNSELVAWEITTPDGFIYSFNEYEDFQEGGGTIKSAWYLTKITSAKGGEVNFQYAAVQNRLQPVGAYTQTRNPVILTFAPTNYCTSPWNGPAFYPGNDPLNTPIAGKQYKNLYLDKITFRDGEIRFTYSTDRADILYDVKLTKVQVYRNTYNPATTQLFKEWALDYGYFVGSTDQDYTQTSPITADHISKRLKLISVTEKDASGNALQPYSFTYNNEDLLGAYPAKTSFARDHWGYFNGKFSNTSLIPDFASIGTTSDIIRYYLGTMGDQRDPDPNFSQLFSLKEVKYPTGGKTVFEYEPNDFDYFNSRVGDQSYFANVLDPEAKQINLSFPGNVTGDQPAAQNLPNVDLSDMYLASLPLQTNQHVKFTYFFLFTNPNNDCVPATFANQVNYTLSNEAGTQIFDFQIDPVTSQNVDCNVPAGMQHYGISITRDIVLTPGKYSWKLHINSGTTWLSHVMVKVEYIARADLQVNTAMAGTGIGGGLRIKRMLTYDNTTQTAPAIKRYLYNYLDATDSKLHSSGLRMAKPIYAYFQKQNKVNICAGPSDLPFQGAYQLLIQESDSHNPVNGASGGGSVGYSKVIELSGDNGEYGKSEYFYENTPDKIFNYAYFDFVTSNSDATYVPQRPPINSSLANSGNGNLIQQIDYRFKNNAYEKIAETINAYADYIGTTTPMWYGIEKRGLQGTALVPDNCDYLNVVYPAIVENRKLLSYTISNIYDLNDPAKSLTTLTKYTYDHTTHLQLKQTEQFINNGNSKVTKLTYPADYTDTEAGTVVADMKNNRFMHNSVITSKTTLNNSTGTSIQAIGGMINKYQVVNSKIVNQETAVLELAQPVLASSMIPYLPSSGSTYPSNYAPKLLFEAYDNANNIIQMRKKDDQPVSLVWDYNNGYPVAEVTNAVQADIAYTSFEADGAGNWTIPSTSRSTSFSVTGERSYSLTSGNLSRSGLTTGKVYVVSYWSKTGAAYTLTGGTVIITRQGRAYNGWTLFETEITATGTTLTISGGGLIDEVRCYPKGSLMNTYTYSPVIGMTSQCDAANKITYYEYDGFGRLVLLRDQDGNVVKTFEYKYKQ